MYALYTKGGGGGGGGNPLSPCLVTADTCCLQHCSLACMSDNINMCHMSWHCVGRCIAVEHISQPKPSPSHKAITVHLGAYVHAHVLPVQPILCASNRSLLDHLATVQSSNRQEEAQPAAASGPLEPVKTALSRLGLARDARDVPASPQSTGAWCCNWCHV